MISLKHIKVIISVLLAVTLVAALFTACKGNASKNGKGTTQIVEVTDENGEKVTDEYGKVVTTVITDNSGENSDEGGVVVVDGGDTTAAAADGGNNSADSATTKGGSKSTTAATKKKDKKKEKVTKPAAPATPSDFKATDITKDSLTLTWKAVKCDAYEIQYKASGRDWEVLKDSTTAVKIPIKGLNSYTSYAFRVRAYSENTAGKSASKWAQTTAKTKADEKNKRFIKIKAKLPIDSNKKETIQLYVNNTLIKEQEVNCNGKYFTFTTEKKYEGLVTVKAVLKSSKTTSAIQTDKDSCVLDLTAIGIDVIIDEDEFD